MERSEEINNNKLQPKENEMTKQVSQQPAKKSLREVIFSDEIIRGFENALDGSHIGANEFAAKLLIAMSKQGENGNKGPADCTMNSKLIVAHELASLNLVPAYSQVALIPRKNKSGDVELNYMIQFQGYKALIDRSTEIFDTTVVLLHVRDSYTYDSETQHVHPTIDPFDPLREFKTLDDIAGGYLVIKYKDRTRPDKHVLVPRDQFVKARACAQTTKVWDAWLLQQCWKTVYRFAFARREVPIDPKVAGLMTTAIEKEDEIFGNDPNRVVQSRPARIVQAGTAKPVASLDDLVGNDVVAPAQKESEQRATQKTTSSKPPTKKIEKPKFDPPEAEKRQPKPEDFKKFGAEIDKQATEAGIEKVVDAFVMTFVLNDQDLSYIADRKEQAVTELKG